MRIPVALMLLTAFLSGTPAAQDCSIENATQAEVGPRKGVTGICSNNGEPIECSYAVDGTISCTGPNGTFSNDDLDALVASACGCGD